MKNNEASSSSAIDHLSRYLMTTENACELCESPGGEVLWEDDFCRVVRVADADYPGFCRVILRQHVSEMTELCSADRERLMQVVFAVERALKQSLSPDKINLASFGNVVAHLHWHVIPRWRDDRHFPQPIWGTPQRTSSPSRSHLSSRHLADQIAACMHNASTGRTT